FRMLELEVGSAGALATRETLMLKPYWKEQTMGSEGQFPEMEEDILRGRAIDYFKNLLSSVIKLPGHQIEANVSLESYGIDSIMVMQLTNQLEKKFGSLSKTLFFEYQTIQELSEYFLETHREKLTALLGIEESAEASILKMKDAVAESMPVKSEMSGRSRR